MKHNTLIFVAFVLAGISALSGCGPSRETLATRTAAMQTATATMWTPTSTVTPTSTLTPTHTSTPTVDSRYYETSGEIHFSYVPPVGWAQSQPVNGSLMGWYWKGETMTCPLAFTMEKSDLALESYFQKSQAEMAKMFADFSVLSQAPFITDAKVEAIKMEASFTLSMGVDIKLYAAIYVFHQGGYLVIAVYDRPYDLDNSQDPIVDTSMRTFRFEK